MQKRIAKTHCKNALQKRIAKTHCKNALQKRMTSKWRQRFRDNARRKTQGELSTFERNGNVPETQTALKSRKIKLRNRYLSH
jgi:hypothetical protein